MFLGDLLESLESRLDRLSERFPITSKGFSLKKLASLPIGDSKYDPSAKFLTTNSSGKPLTTQIEYAKASLPLLGQGSSRAAFNFEGMALKIARTSAGATQNALEAQICGSDYDVVCELYYEDPKNSFIITELASQPWGSDWSGNEFRNIFFEVVGIAWWSFHRYISSWYEAYGTGSSLFDITEEEFNQRVRDEHLESVAKDPWVQQVIMMVKEFDLLPGDMTPTNMGVVTREYGREIVILDAGFSRFTYHIHYGKDTDMAAPEYFTRPNPSLKNLKRNSLHLPAVSLSLIVHRRLLLTMKARRIFILKMKTNKVRLGSVFA